jgi:hypothetical protein
METETPIRPGLEVDPEIAQILAERDRTFDHDKVTAVDARQALAELRRNLQRHQPR